MTFNPVAALNVIECKDLISGKSLKAMDLGSQTITINKKFIEHAIKNNTISNSLIVTNLKNLCKINNFNTKDFFRCIGFNKYSSIDLNGAYDSLQFDLNKNIKEAYNFNEKYELVINNGTGEHVFNQHSLFINFHNLTEVEGIMLNILPFIDWVNHGFYNFNPIFLLI